MPACLIERKNGTNDILIMFFQSPARVTVGDENIAITEPGIFIWDKDTPQIYGARNDNWVHSWIHCEGSLVDQLLDETQLPFKTPCPITSNPRFVETLYALYLETLSPNTDTPIAVSLFSAFIRQVGQCTSTEKKEYPLRLEKALHFINKHFTEPLTVAQIANVAGMSEPHFAALFKKQFQVSPINFVTGLRVQYAMHLMTQGGISIAEAGWRAGYKDPAYFSRQFKRAVKISPREWLQAHHQH